VIVQLIPPPFTVPLPAPPAFTVSVLGCGGALNVAVTVWLLLSVTEQLPPPVQPPPVQPANVLPPTCAAVSVTVVPALREIEQVPFVVPFDIAQLIPPPVTTPVPVPPAATVKVNVCETGALNVATAVMLPLTTTVQGPVPEQLPVQPPNVPPPDGVGVSVTEVPAFTLI
jgi:hypothetical protein